MTIGRIDSISRILLFCILLVSLTKAIPFLPVVPDTIYYGSLLGALIWLILREGLMLSYTYLPFLIAIILSVWVNEIPAYFRVWFRVMAFASVVLAIGPFFVNPVMIAWRRLLFVYTLTAIRWIVLASFIGWACRLRYVHGYSGFQGFTNQSMLIGPFGGISFIYSVYRYYLSSTVFDRYKEMGIAIVSIVVLLLAGSRSALGATFLAAVFLYSRIYRHHITRLGRILLTVLCLSVLTSGIWWPYTERLRSKMDSSKKSGSLTLTRNGLWQDRIREFKAFPVFGVGFSTVNMEYVRAEDKVNQKSGMVEPGSGWLFLLSSMGLVGFLSFFIPFTYSMYSLFRRESVGLNGYFLGSLLFLFFFHLFFEGYLMASGAYLCFFLWLLLSECNKLVNTNN